MVSWGSGQGEGKVILEGTVNLPTSELIDYGADKGKRLPHYVKWRLVKRFDIIQLVGYQGSIPGPSTPIEHPRILYKGKPSREKVEKLATLLFHSWGQGDVEPELEHYKGLRLVAEGRLKKAGGKHNPIKVRNTISTLDLKQLKHYELFQREGLTYPEMLSVLFQLSRRERVVQEELEDIPGLMAEDFQQPTVEELIELTKLIGELKLPRRGLAHYSDPLPLSTLEFIAGLGSSQAERLTLLRRLASELYPHLPQESLEDFYLRSPALPLRFLLLKDKTSELKESWGLSTTREKKALLRWLLTKKRYSSYDFASSFRLLKASALLPRTRKHPLLYRAPQGGDLRASYHLLGLRSLFTLRREEREEKINSSYRGLINYSGYKNVLIALSKVVGVKALRSFTEEWQEARERAKAQDAGAELFHLSNFVLLAQQQQALASLSLQQQLILAGEPEELYS